MNESDLNYVKKYKFDNPLFLEIDSIIDSGLKNCHNSYFHKYEYECIFDIKRKYHD